MPVTVAQCDFTAGELAPSLLGRVDFAKYTRGCRTLRNFLVQPHGGAVKRPGFLLLDALPGDAVLVPFVFNVEQTYCLVFGEKWLRVAVHEGSVMSGGAPYQIESPYTLEAARQFSFVQSGDKMFFACHGVSPRILTRHGHADWRWEEMALEAQLAAPAWVEWSETHEFYDYTHAYYANELYERIRFDDTEYDRYEFHEVPYDLYTREGSSSTSGGKGAMFVNAALDSAGNVSPAQLTTPYTYHVTAVTEKGGESPLSAPAAITGPASSNWQAGDYIQLRWNRVADAADYRVYKASFGGRPGYIGTVKASESGELTFADNNISPSLAEGAPSYVDRWPDGDYPGTVCLFEQRLVFASSPKRPQTIWMSKSGDYTNFAEYTPVTDDAPLEMTLAGSEVAAVQWMVPLRSLVLGTSGMEWELRAADGGAFGVRTAKASPQSYWGSSLKRAIVVGNIVLHVNAAGSQVRNLQYDFAADSYGGTDLSILAAHLLEGTRITDWTYAKTPDSIIWAVRSDGVLLGLTFQQEHQITAWHRHDTQGAFMAVCAVPHEYEYSLFAVVRRNGKHLLERMAERHKTGDVVNAVHLDAALPYSGAPTSRVSGLEHLEGRQVGVFADGKALAPRTVRGGSVSLDAPARTVAVGLEFTADLETMPVEITGQDGVSLGMPRQISTVDVLFQGSMGVQVGICKNLGNFDTATWQDVRWRKPETEAPFTGMRQITVPAMAEQALTICIRSDEPTPVTVLAVAARLAVNTR